MHSVQLLLALLLIVAPHTAFAEGVYATGLQEKPKFVFNTALVLPTAGPDCTSVLDIDQGISYYHKLQRDSEKQSLPLIKDVTGAVYDFELDYRWVRHHLNNVHTVSMCT